MSAETTPATAQPPIDRVLADYTRRSRAQLLLRAGLFTVLAAACGGVGTWRLLAAQVHPALGWAPAATAAALVLAVGVWSALRWRSAGGAQAADYLDRTLGLEERLSTAMEFSGVENPPALYEELLRDTTTRLGRVRTRQSRALAYGGAFLTVLLLVLIFWPNARPLLQLAKPSPDSKAASPEPDAKDSENQDSGTDSNADTGSSPDGGNASTGDSGQPGDASDAGESGGPDESGGSQQQEGGASSGKSQQDSGGASSPQQNAESGSSQPDDQGRPPSEGQQPDQADRQPSSDQAKNSDQTDGKGKGQSQSGQGNKRSSEGNKQSGEGNKKDGSSASSGESQQQAKQGSSGGGGKEGSASAPQKAQAGGQPRSDDGGSGKQGSGQTVLAQAAQGMAQQGAGNVNPANQEAMKAEIRQLLKEISAEVKDIQDQLSKSQPPPVPGAGTDPEIYGEDSPMPPVPAGEGNVPLQLKTDEAPTQSGRTGGGVGKASGEVSADAPKAKAEAANLSDDPVEETPVSRQAIPAEYRGVFDKLHQR